MASPRSFLTLEQSLTRALRARWARDVGAPATRAIRAALGRGDYAGAAQLVEGLTFSGALEAEGGRLQTTALAAFLMGQSFAAGRAERGTLARGAQSPLQVQIAVQALATGLTKAEEALRQRLRMLVAREEAEARGVGFKQEEDELGTEIALLVAGGGATALDTAGHLLVSRLAQYGFLVEAVDRNIQRFRVEEVLDERTCPVCEEMNGQEFEVAPAAARLESQLMVADPAELATAQPFPEIADLVQLSPESLQAAGYDTPPYHPFCRGILIPA